MSITPSGAPAWLRSNDHSAYGGHVDKTNYQSIGVVNPRTDVGAEAITRFASDLASCARTAPFCTLTVLCDDGTPADPTVEAVNQMTGVRVTTYAGGAPPAGFPTVTRNGDGDVTFTWAATYDDPYGVSGAVSLYHALVTIHGTTPLASVVVITSPAIRVRVFTTAGVAATSPRFSLSTA